MDQAERENKRDTVIGGTPHFVKGISIVQPGSHRGYWRKNHLVILAREGKMNHAENARARFLTGSVHR